MTAGRGPMARLRDLRDEWRPAAVTGGEPFFPLFVLFGLNAVDELDRTAYAVLLPEIRDHFGLGNTGILSVVAASVVVIILLEIPLAHYADRGSRVRIATLGALAWAVFSVGTGFALTVGMLVAARVGAGLGRSVVTPTHNSLLADYYSPASRVKVYSFHRLASSVGQMVGPLAAGVIAWALGWRAPFILLALPTLVFVVLATRLRDPVRGGHDRRAAGADAATAAVEEQPLPFRDSVRALARIPTLRRVWLAVPFLAVALFGITSLISLVYEEIFGLSEVQRGMVSAAAEPAQLIGVVAVMPFAARLAARHPALLLRLCAVVGFLNGILLAVFAYAPNLGVAVTMHLLIAASVGILGPGVFAVLSLTLPPRSRALGFSILSVFAVPGVVIVLPLIGVVGDRYGLRVGTLVMIPVAVMAGLLLASAGRFLAADIDRVRRDSAVAARRGAAGGGRPPVLEISGLEVAYDGVQVLFGVDMDVDEGEIVALLGTNGAGKSTVLRAISGVVAAGGGQIRLDGTDVTGRPAHQLAALGIVQAPGGSGVFPSLTVAEHLRLGGWTERRDGKALAAAVEHAIEVFPELRDRWHEPAGNLSGGQQQMLTLAMALVTRPRLLLIDELSLGLAPTIVERLLGVVEEIRSRGTSIVLVEQSVNVALTVAGRAYFLEKGQVRFTGPTADLLERPDLLRSVFLEGAGAGRTPGRATAVGQPGRRLSDPVPTAAALEIIGVSRRFGGVRAVDSVSAAVGPGEVLGVIGPNGAGKTTLFDIVSGFLPADEGRVVLHGTDITTLRPDRRARLGLGRSFQDARLFPGLTVAEAVAVALDPMVDVTDPVAIALAVPDAAASERRTREEADTLLGLLGLVGYRDHFVAELSTGTRRVVDLACVLAQKPTVVLFDEPSAGIAQREAEALGPLLLRIRDETGAALIVIEHDMPLLLGITDRLLALDLGQVVADGAPAAVLEDERVVASYLGTDQAAIHRSGTTGNGKTAAGTGGRRRRPRREAATR